MMQYFLMKFFTGCKIWTVFQKAHTVLNEGGKFAFNVVSSIEKHFRVPEIYSE